MNERDAVMDVNNSNNANAIDGETSVYFYITNAAACP